MILKVLKKIVFSILIIYSLNLLVSNLNVFVPLNLYTITFVTLLGFPGLTSLVLTFFFLL
ncbi:MAG TPA: hypothetical protein GX713_00655 [Mollicutes bacterium]|nr:hypothetical protein [Mollicutes bacterium]